MKKWITIAGMLILTLPVMVQATDYPSTNVTITLSAGYNLVCYAYEPVSTNGNTIGELFKELSNGSKIYVWNSASQSWAPPYTRGPLNWGASGTNRLTRGVGAYVQVLAQKDIHFSGALPLDETRAVNTDELMAYPYPVDIAFTNTEISKVASLITVWSNGSWVPYGLHNGEWDSGAKNLILKNCNNAFFCEPKGLIVYERNPYLPPNVPYLPPVSWMDQYGLTNHLEDVAADQDSDGLKTWQEYIAGTNPTNPASGFCVTEDPRNVLGWNVVSGRVYSVYWTTNLMSGFQCLESNIPWTQGSFTNSTDASCGYYKIGVRLEN
ncbi:MAG: hypothetical protein WCH86_07940 [Kiritimatiellales bacterium]